MVLAPLCSWAAAGGSHFETFDCEAISSGDARLCLLRELRTRLGRPEDSGGAAAVSAGTPRLPRTPRVRLRGAGCGAS